MIVKCKYLFLNGYKYFEKNRKKRLRDGVMEDWSDGVME